MDKDFCPNIGTCRLVTTDVVVPDDKNKKMFMDSWCRQPAETWNICKRYITKRELSFCPDFVLPDTELSVEEIIERFDAQSLS
ncbi:MAG TPA: hypothetical protein VK994_03830 [Bacteroidales bacterium]|nr:hypothetical protein [Bacteroidales bacterium]